MKERTLVWACGGGTQSAAIAALIVTGRLPMPDLALIVDTGREKTATWDYYASVLRPALAAAGLDLQRVPKGEFATVDTHSHKGSLLLPVFTDKNEAVGKLTNFCSGEWKRRVSERWMRSLGVRQADVWIGISVDEMRRMRYSRLQWVTNRYPLIEPEFALSFRRSDCLTEVERIGWPPPPRSSCWMCPNMANAEWREMRDCYPEDFARAVEFETLMRKGDANAWLHPSCVPIAEVDFGAAGTLFTDRACDSGLCGV